MADDGFKNKVIPACGRMYRLALRITGNADDAEDAVQDAMVRLWERRDSLARVDNVEAYAMMTVRNCSLDIVGRRIPQADPGLEAVSGDGAEVFEAVDRLAQVRTVIGTLPPNQAEVIILRDIEGCTVEEIQAKTGLTSGNIRVLLCRARNYVRKYFVSI